MIYLVAPGELDPVKNGYVSRWVSLLQAIEEKGRQVCIVTTSFIHSTRESFRTDDERFVVLECGGYDKNIGFRRWLYNLKFALSVSCWALRNRTAIRGGSVLFNSIPPENAFPGLLFRFLGAKVFVDVRDLWPEAIQATDSRKRIDVIIWSVYARFLTSLLLRCAKAVFYTSKLYERRLRSLESYFVPLGVDMNRWESVGLPNRADGQESAILGYIGSKSLQCDMTDVYGALESSIHRLEVIGRYPQDEISGYRWVRFFGYQSGAQLISLVSEWTVGVVPDMSFSGAGLPNKLFDYVGAHRPVIIMKRSNDISEIDRFVKDNSIGDIFVIGSENFDIWFSRYLSEIEKFKSGVEAVRRRYARSFLYEKMSAELCS